ncbi:uncharacterized protein EI90DRAFT_3123045 [Cantharellus anzutake]|uniref:uncharacterized protein n=1 Tax=Cantharellus anzutake TaxID=1750568 RepID=UPI00190401F1|nr:uncharacterized protein EI90DRAFT_3123045 [Cantharellus anzutake]KAF8331941.1 hypothetical protein EI90DRAFT_3123045 [Cantharellus anzutake]
MHTSRMLSIFFLFFAALLSPVLSAPVARPEMVEGDLLEREPLAELSTSEVADTEKRNTHTGQGTWFYPGLGACGGTDGNNSPIIAISAKIWNGGKHCGKWVHIKNTKNKKTTKAKVVDECPGCGSGSLDMSPAVFKKLASQGLDEGVIPVSWTYQ